MRRCKHGGVVLRHSSRFSHSEEKNSGFGARSPEAMNHGGAQVWRCHGGGREMN